MYGPRYPCLLAKPAGRCPYTWCPLPCWARASTPTPHWAMSSTVSAGAYQLRCPGQAQGDSAPCPPVCVLCHLYAGPGVPSPQCGTLGRTLLSSQLVWFMLIGDQLRQPGSAVSCSCTCYRLQGRVLGRRCAAAGAGHLTHPGGCRAKSEGCGPWTGGRYGVCARLMGCGTGREEGAAPRPGGTWGTPRQAPFDCVADTGMSLSHSKAHATDATNVTYRELRLICQRH